MSAVRTGHARLASRAGRQFCASTCPAFARLERAASAENAADCQAALDFIVTLMAEFEDAVRAKFGVVADPVGGLEPARQS